MKQNISNGMIIKDVPGESFPGETFRVLKDKEICAFGEYRTKYLILDAWEKIMGGEK
jgi:hypothetical protein